MDIHELTQALNEATQDLDPRKGFADAVVAGGRRRRTRSRIGLTAAVAGMAAAAAVVMVTVPGQQSAPPPGASTTTPFTPKEDLRFVSSGGELVDDEEVRADVLHAWNTGITSDPINAERVYTDRHGEPHVYWAGRTPYGITAIVMQTIQLPADDRVAPEQRRQQRIVTGVVATAPATDELRLLGVQADDPGQQGRFLLPDDRTVIAVASPDTGLWISPEIRYDRNISERAWTAVPRTEGVGVVELPEGTDPLNVRLVAGAPDVAPTEDGGKKGAHLPLLRTATYPDAPPGFTHKGLDWTGTFAAGAPRELATAPTDIFVKAMGDARVLDASSFVARRPEWTIVVGTPDGDTTIVGEWQELNHPAHLWAVTIRPDGETVRSIEMVGEADPNSDQPIQHWLPGAESLLVIAPGEQLSYRHPEGQWSDPVSDVLMAPDEATKLRVGTQVHDKVKNPVR